MANKDQPARMWKYWLEDKGLETAAEDHYPQAFKTDPILAVALAQYHTALAMIDIRMEQRANEEDDNEG